MSYEPPEGNKIAISFSGEPYVTPDGGKIRIEFRVTEVPPESTVQYLFPEGFDHIQFGEAFARHTYRMIAPTGLVDTAFGTNSLKNNARLLRPTGFNTATYGTAFLQHALRTLKPSGFNALRLGTPSLQGGVKYLNPTAIPPRMVFGTVKVVNTRANQTVKPSGITAIAIGNTHVIYNLRQYIRLNSQGIAPRPFGTAYLQGGVKKITLSGINALRLGTPSLVNTKADQYVKTTGITHWAFGRPIVSPRYVNAKGFANQVFGTPSIRKHPMAKGWASQAFGNPWVSESPRYYQVGIGNVSRYGIARIFDPTQKIGVYGPIAGGIFGDISTRNVNFFIRPPSIVVPTISTWNNVENKNRAYSPNGFNAAVFGTTEIQNKSPNLTPDLFEMGDIGAVHVGYRIRDIRVKTFDASAVGKPIVVKTPSVHPVGITPGTVARPLVANYQRFVYTSGSHFMVFGTAKIEMLHRPLRTSGLNFMRLGEPDVTHEIRELLVRGSNFMAFGSNHRLWFKVRTIEPDGIAKKEIPATHMLGRKLFIEPEGFVASLFGEGITPPQQTLGARNFVATVFGQTTIAKLRQYVKPNGFLTLGTDPAARWGYGKLYNKRQYIIQTYDVDSDLNPPKWPQWLVIENRSRYLGVTGNHMAKFGRPEIYNNARPIKPGGFNYPALGTVFISHHTRPIYFEGLEPPYISGWHNVWNSAKVISPLGIDSARFEKPSVVNTRRYFPWIGNIESQVFGEPMVSFRIRELTFEHRYGIAPIYIPIHEVKLYTRYLEAQGDEFGKVGLPALSIHRKIITTRWTHREYFGSPELKNLTPELMTRGRNFEEFGHPSIRTQWREIFIQGDQATFIPKPVIGYRTRKITVTPIKPGGVGAKLVVKGTASPPLTAQYIYLNDVSNWDDGSDQGEEVTTIKDGFGIRPPSPAGGTPRVRSNVLRPTGFSTMRIGDLDIVSNGILIENGIKLADECGTPRLQLKIRRMYVDGMNERITVGKPRLSPHTIYAVTGGTNQAKNNHPDRHLHFVNSNNGNRDPGEVFGNPRVWMRKPYSNNVEGIRSKLEFGTARVRLYKRYIEVKGLQAYRFGWHEVGDGTKTLTHRGGGNWMEMGRPSIKRVEVIDLTTRVHLSGTNYSGYGTVKISNWIRTVRPNGINSLSMGSSRSGTLYMPQSLNVGPRRPTIPTGTNMQRFGTTYIGHLVRELKIVGFDSFTMGYVPLYFDGRMKVIKQPGPKPAAQGIGMQGFNAGLCGVPNVRLGVHYIRPDGNAEQYRKGAF